MTRTLAQAPGRLQSHSAKALEPLCGEDVSVSVVFSAGEVMISINYCLNLLLSRWRAWVSCTSQSACNTKLFLPSSIGCLPSPTHHAPPSPVTRLSVFFPVKFAVYLPPCTSVTCLSLCQIDTQPLTFCRHLRDCHCSCHSARHSFCHKTLRLFVFTSLPLLPLSLP